MSDTGARLPTVTSNIINWTGLNNVKVEDGTFATSATSVTVGSVGSFGFSIPTDATIVGIEVIIKSKALPSSGVNAASVAIQSAQGPNALQKYFTPGTTLADITMGGPTDLWGDLWEPSDFTDANFLAAITFTGGGANTLSVDAYKVKVYYTPNAVSPQTKTATTAPGTVADGGGSDGLWTDVNNVKTSDGLKAVGDTSNGGQHTNTLKSTNFGFAIPNGSIIKGIEVQVNKLGTPTADLQAQLIKGGVVTGTNQPDNVNYWPVTQAYTKYGGSSDLWGLTWTPADINASNFGFAFAAYNVHGGGQSLVEHIRMIIHYVPPQAPLQPTGLTPSGGAAVETLTPRLSWTHSPGQVGDTQSAFRVIVTRQSDSVVMVDTGKVTSTNQYYDVLSGAGLAYGVTYQWKVLTYSAVDLIGPYSSNVVFRPSQKPTVSIDYPVDSGTANSDTPLIQWTYADPESTAQTRYKVEILNNAATVVLYNSGFVTSVVGFHQIPADILENGTTYKVRVTVTDTDALDSTPDTNTFTVSFVSPTAPTVVGTIDSETNANLVITLQPPVDDGWSDDYLRIYKKKTTDPGYELYVDNYPITYLNVDSAESITGWTESGVGRTPILGVAKDGNNALGLGATGSGDAHYTKTVGLPNYSAYDQIQIWFRAADVTKFTKFRVKFGLDSSNYYYYDVLASSMTDGSWKMGYKNFADLSVTGSPSQTVLSYFVIDIVGATGSIPAGDILIDQIKFLKTSYTYKDYDTANGKTYKYGVSAYNIEQSLESPKGETSNLTVTFPAEFLNTYLIPIDDPTQLLKGWMDGDKSPSWTDRTDIKYYNTRGSSKPAVLVSGTDRHKEGTVELRFFDSRFGGDGLDGIDALEAIKNFKPILLKTWWGKNYYISIDGDVSTSRKPGIGWYATFSFTEID